jgi:serine protease Do
MRIFIIWITITLSWGLGFTEYSPKDIYLKYRDSICLVSYFQNLASESRIGSFNKIKKYRIGILLNDQGLVLVSSDVFPVSLDIISGNGSYLSRTPTDFKVKFSDNKEFPGEFIGKDDQTQVALIKIMDFAGDQKIQPISFNSEKILSVADTIFVLELLPENYNFELLFTPHIISSVIESPQKKYIVNNYTTALSAGGLVLDSQGEAIGVTIKQSNNFTSGFTPDIEEWQKNFLEIAPAFWFAHMVKNPTQLVSKEAGRRSWLGIRMQALNKDLQKYWQVPQDGGIIINRIFEESPAELAGLQVGDIILKINDSTLLVQKDEDTARLRNLIREHPVEEPLNMQIFRGGKILLKKVIPTAAPKAIGLAESVSVSSLGFEIRELTRDILYQENLSLTTPGVFVYQVDRASAAGLGGLLIGDIVVEINDQPVKTLKEAEEIVNKTSQNPMPMIKLKVMNRRITRFVFIENKHD